MFTYALVAVLLAAPVHGKPSEPVRMRLASDMDGLTCLEAIDGYQKKLAYIHKKLGETVVVTCERDGAVE